MVLRGLGMDPQPARRLPVLPRLPCAAFILLSVILDFFLFGVDTPFHNEIIRSVSTEMSSSASGLSSSLMDSRKPQRIHVFTPSGPALPFLLGIPKKGFVRSSHWRVSGAQRGQV